jgi:hypothetical protein
MKERGGNLIHPGDAAQKKGTNNSSGGVLDNDDVEFNNAGPGGGGPTSMIGDEDNWAGRPTKGWQQ